MDDPSFKPVSQAQLNKAFAVQVQVNDSANKGKFDSRNIFTIGGNSQSELVKNFDGQSVTESEEEEDVDVDIISDYMGHYGWYQFFWTFLLCLFQFPTTFHIFCLVFQAAMKDFWCERPEHLKSISVELWRNLTQPEDHCSMLNAPYSTLSASNITDYFASQPNLELIKCKSFEYDMSFIGQTIISEWSLVCDKLFLGSVVEMCFLAGAAIGSVISGYISDQYGRKHTLLMFALIQAVCGISLGFCESLALYMALRVVIGFSSMAVVVVSFVLCVELVSGKWRTVIGILNILPVAIAYLFCALISYLTFNWRTMQFVITVPGMLLLLTWYNMPESPRWLLSKGRVEELKLIIEKAAYWNSRELPPSYEKTLIVSQTASERSVSIFDLFQTGYKKTTFLMAIVWFSIILIYFGITLHMSSLGGNVYINTVIAGSVEAISICASILVVLKLGLRVNIFIYMLVAGAACLLINFVRNDNLWLTISLAMIVKCTIGACNAIIPTFTAYQYPTYMRNLGIGSGNLAAGAALVIVPYLFLLEHVNVHLPMSIMGIVGIVGAIALLLLNDKLSKKTKAADTRQIHITVVPAKESNGLNNVAFVSTEDSDSIDNEVYTSPQI